jgi:hypothetical protein
MAIAWDRDPWEKPTLPGGDKAAAMAILRALPPATLAAWDAKTGPALNHLSAQDLQDAGFRPLHRESYTLDGWLPAFKIFGGGTRTQTMYLLYKDLPAAPAVDGELAAPVANGA